jgi:hypothetical protein
VIINPRRAYEAGGVLYFTKLHILRRQWLKQLPLKFSKQTDDFLKRISVLLTNITTSAMKSAQSISATKTRRINKNIYNGEHQTGRNIGNTLKADRRLQNRSRV